MNANDHQASKYPLSRSDNPLKTSASASSSRLGDSLTIRPLATRILEVDVIPLQHALHSPDSIFLPTDGSSPANRHIMNQNSHQNSYPSARDASLVHANSVKMDIQTCHALPCLALPRLSVNYLPVCL
ncbi:hypothetical protein KC19_12G121100 [Ceratodon purpureus]|uniref:Uncharacterized protein n=1 Tax=Ceratodon purpureus TaxID=3225 RepID=A0A8T0GC48_CERPU|nr:hypothetical protein KC19_12G121100 [Ceratodon purpureus]